MASLVVARSLVARSLVVRRLVLLCVAALFAVVALFAAATLQPAIAQDDSSHEVTIEVEPVQKLTIENDVGPVTVSELSYPGLSDPGESGLNFDEDGESTTGTFEIQTNLTGQRVEAMVVEEESQIGGLGLEVSLTGLDGGDTNYGYQTLLQPGDTDPEAETVAVDIGQTKTGGTLTYRAAATPEFDPNSDATVQVQYTLTGQSGGQSGQ
ncbi:hypothetical protein GGP55_003142 [Salinibacter ruber]|nr:hypothetical protein [Salinibacter ruber]